MRRRGGRQWWPWVRYKPKGCRTSLLLVKMRCLCTRKPVTTKNMMQSWFVGWMLNQLGILKLFKIAILKTSHPPATNENLFISLHLKTVFCSFSRGVSELCRDVQDNWLLVRVGADQVRRGEGGSWGGGRGCKRGSHVAACYIVVCYINRRAAVPGLWLDDAAGEGGVGNRGLGRLGRDQQQ